MNKVFLWSIAIFLLSLFLGCKNDFVFPDPGFDLVSGKSVVVRRDTANSYMIRLNVKAPAGIESIQILNGRSYELLDELFEYGGQEDFLFQYRLDFTEIDENRDSVLIYNVRIITRDERAFNSSFKIDLKKLSRPELILPNNEYIGTTVPVVGIRGLASAGIYKLKSIRISIDGEVLYRVPDEELRDSSEYKLVANVIYPFEVGKEYQLCIEVTDERGERIERNILIKGIRTKKANRVVVISGGRDYGLYDIYYDESDRINKIGYSCMVMPADSYVLNFVYDPDGNVKRCEYYYDNNPKIRTLAYIDFTYVAGKLEQAVHGYYNMDIPENKGIYEILQNIRYRPDGTIWRLDVGITTIDEIAYADGFFSGEKIFSERWMGVLSSLSLGERMIRTDFIPVLNPVYVQGLPQIWCANWFGEEMGLLFWYKYVYTTEGSGYGYPGDPVSFLMYSYSCSEDGQLETFESIHGGMVYRYEYD